jgi:hypothetical protein
MKKIAVGSIFVAGILLLSTSVVSVIGTTTETSTAVSSPLFIHRIQQSNQKTASQINANYLGKGAPLMLAFTSRTSLDGLVDNAVRLITQNPSILNQIVTRMQQFPSTARLLKTYGVNQGDLKQYVTQLQQDPSLLQQQLDAAKAEIQGGDQGRPLSLNTSNPFACVITIIALLPVLLVLVLVIATITIVTCLNINDCFTKLADQLLLQHLLPP